LARVAGYIPRRHTHLGTGPTLSSFVDVINAVGKTATVAFTLA